MIRNALFVSFALIISIGFAGCGGGDSTDVDVSVHDNWVLFDPWVGDIPLAFSLADHSITSGQPWDGVSTGVQNGTWGIDVRAGRHASGSVASWFRQHASAAWCANWPAGCPEWPSELNFAMTGTLTINGTSYPVTIGQGSVADVHNNWWIGGPGWTLQVSPWGNSVVTPDGKYSINAMDDTFNEFQIAIK